MKDTFSKNYSGTGYTWDEDIAKRKEVDSAHGNGHGKWKPAEIVPDPRGGYQVEISTK